MKDLVDFLTNLIVKHTPFKGRRTKLTSLLTIVAIATLIALGKMEPVVGTPLIVLAVNDLFAADHQA